VIYKSALIAAAAMALVALLTGKDVVRTRRITLNQLQYNLKLFNNNSVEVEREDGLRFTIDGPTFKPVLIVGTEAQLQDAMVQMKKYMLAELGAVAA
jgi:hypothetical protein